MATAVVCDDDPVTRAAITVSCEEAGLEVVAETDHSSDATELIRRFEVDVLVLGLSPSDGSGERTVDRFHQDRAGVCVVVFTTSATDPWRLLRLGVRQVIAKPDFELLQHVLTRLGRSIDLSAPPDERRRASRAVSDAPPMWCSPAGVSPHDDLTRSLPCMAVGDAVLAVTIVGLDELETDVGPLLAADCRLAVAGTLRGELRAQDLLHEAPDVNGFVALLRGGDARAAGAVWSRLTAALRTAALPGEVKGATSRLDTSGAGDALARAIGQLQDAAVGSPAFTSV